MNARDAMHTTNRRRASAIIAITLIVAASASLVLRSEAPVEVSAAANPERPDVGAAVNPDRPDVRAGRPQAPAAQDPSLRVETAEGPVVGVAGVGALSWKGIPFSAPPVGALRWRAPQAAAVRDGALDAFAFGPVCPQDSRDALSPGESERSGAEDCLTLNIWRPSAGGADVGLPVLFWIHGGGHVQGSGSETLYDGARLAIAGDVVVVTINYRLGALGFLVHPAFIDHDPDVPGAGNYGRLDQLAALAWVRANIAGFGGDPERITIFGESAGGVSACDLVASPLAADLFRAAIMQSGACLDDRSIPRLAEPVGALPPATQQGERFAAAAGCGDTSRPADCLRAMSTDTVLDTLPGEIGILNATAETYGPVIDGHVHLESPAAAIRNGRANAVAFVAGANADEGTIFLSPALRAIGESAFRALVGSTFPGHADAILALYPPEDYDTPGDALAAITGDAGFVCNARRAARDHAAAGRPAWLYHFTHVPAYAETLGIGSHHGAEIPYVFGSPAARVRAEDRTLSDVMQAAWSAVAADGEPSVTSDGTVDGAPVEWPRFDEDTNVGLQFATGDDLGMVEGWRDAKCDLWDEIAGPTPIVEPTTVPEPGPFVIHLPQLARGE